MVKNEEVTTELGTYKISIHLTTGEIREHIYPYSTVQDTEKVTETLNRITCSIARHTWLWKILQHDYIPGILLLDYPDTVYNTTYILFYEHEHVKKVMS